MKKLFPLCIFVFIKGMQPDFERSKSFFTEKEAYAEANDFRDRLYKDIPARDFDFFINEALESSRVVSEKVIYLIKKKHYHKHPLMQDDGKSLQFFIEANFWKKLEYLIKNQYPRYQNGLGTSIRELSCGHQVHINCARFLKQNKFECPICKIVIKDVGVYSPPRGKQECIVCKSSLPMKKRQRFLEDD